MNEGLLKEEVKTYPKHQCDNVAFQTANFLFAFTPVKPNFDQLTQFQQESS
jgi:hypothetical protein